MKGLTPEEFDLLAGWGRSDRLTPEQAIVADGLVEVGRALRQPLGSDFFVSMTPAGKVALACAAALRCAGGAA